MRTLVKLSFLACLSFAFILTSCNKGELDHKKYSNDLIFSIESETRSGKQGCYELIFPMNIEMPDGEVIETESLEALKSVFIRWNRGLPSK